MSAEPGAALASISFGQHALHVSEIGRDTDREGRSVGHFLPGSLRVSVAKRRVDQAREPGNSGRWRNELGDAAGASVPRHQLCAGLLRFLVA